MGTYPSLSRSWGSVLALIVAAVVSMGIIARAANAEGVLNGGAFIAGGAESGTSLIDALGGTQLQAPVVNDVSLQASRVSARPASLRERAEAEVGVDIFRHSRLALPLIMHSAVGESTEAALVASNVRLMTGQMVGLKPHPRTWGSTLDR